MDDIYQRIWAADMRGNGVPAVRPGEPRDAKTGFVVVDERAADVDSDHKVLAEVVIPEGKRRTYDLCEALFDNYALERRAAEVVRPEETQEEMDLLNAVVPTLPMQVAKRHLERELDRTISDRVLAAMVRETWFEFGRAGSQVDASGFEHVFVGEQARRASRIGGYHFWYKYWLDDAGRSQPVEPGSGVGRDRIEYRGTRYGGADDPGQGILVPDVVTLSLAWDAPGGDNGEGRTLRKPIGGFFVGLSPEGLMAMGLVRARVRGGQTARINGALYQLDLHPLDEKPNSIRTFFPRFRRADVIDIIEDGDGNGGESAATFRIVAGMINPENPEGGREFLQIINTGAARADLKSWRVVAPNGMSFTLASNEVAPGEIFKFVIPRPDGILRNRGGDIKLVAPDGSVVQTCSYTKEQGDREGQPILF